MVSVSTCVYLILFSLVYSTSFMFFLKPRRTVVPVRPAEDTVYAASPMAAGRRPSLTHILRISFNPEGKLLANLKTSQRLKAFTPPLPSLS